MRKIALAILVVVILVVAWILVSPLFIDHTVNENFDLTNADGVVDMDVVMSMSCDDRMAMKNEIMDAAAEAPDTQVTVDMRVDVPTVVASGQFIDADAIHKGSGTATLYRLPDGAT